MLSTSVVADVLTYCTAHGQIESQVNGGHGVTVDLSYPPFPSFSLTRHSEEQKDESGSGILFFQPHTTAATHHN